jgi:hypothetical protein
VALMRVLLVLFVVTAITAIPGCRCSDADVVAELMEFDGTIERDWAEKLDQWQGAEKGEKFRLGDGVKSGDQSTATLKLGGNALLKLTPKTVVRFLSKATPGHLGMDVMLGEATLETTDQGLRIASSIGAVVVEPGTQMRMSKSEQGIRFEIAVGRARVELTGGKAADLGAGKGIEVGVGGAILEEFDVGDEPTEEPKPEAKPEEADDVNAPIMAHTTGSGASMRPPGGAWQKLAPGSKELQPGTGVKVKGDSSVTIQRGKQAATLKDGEFVVGVPGGYLIQAVKGPVRLSSGGQASVSVPGGVIVAKGDDTSADVTVGGKDGTQIQVHLGDVEVQGKTTSMLHGGESGLLKKDGEMSVGGRGPGNVDLIVNAGDSFTVHDPGPPTAIGFRLGGQCPKGAVVQLSKQQWAGRGGQANAPVEAGRHSYQVRCLGPDGPEKQAVAEGRVIVLRDAGTAPIASGAPTSHVNTDGRRYTVLYQNHLPRITVGWAGAPEAPSYTLVVDSRRIGTSSPNYAFSAGALTEGNHTVRFEAATVPSRKSRVTRIAIRFDNAMPTASLDPIGGKVGADGKMLVAGKALPGWSVSVGGQKLKLDGQSRFRGSAAVPDGHDALPVKFEHPTRGTHYYLRRPSK